MAGRFSSFISHVWGYVLASMAATTIMALGLSAYSFLSGFQKREPDLILPFVRFWCLLAAAIAIVSLVPAMLALWIIYHWRLVSRRAFVVAGSLIGAGTFSVGTALIVLAERGRFDTAPTENETIAVTGFVSIVAGAIAGWVFHRAISR